MQTVTHASKLGKPSTGSTRESSFLFLQIVAPMESLIMCQFVLEDPFGLVLVRDSILTSGAREESRLR